MTKNIDGVYTGASGIVLPVKNKLYYPPEFQDKPRLSYYASLFSSIEINSSFYKLPLGSTCRKWADLVPEHFRFTFKLWQEITHNKGLYFNPDNLEEFFNRVATVEEKKGCILVQFPPSLSILPAQLEQLLIALGNINISYNWKIALEFRNRTWYVDEIFQMIEQYNSTMVIQDLPASATPLNEVDSPCHYVRFHGPNGGYRGSYPEEYLAEYAEYIHHWEQEGKEVYVYFNNTMGDAVNNVLTLNRFLKERKSG